MTNNNIALSIVLPTYNERQNIAILIPEIEESFKDINHEIIVVDDNSPDGTGSCVLELNKRYGNIKLIKKDKREGIGAALRQGYLYAEGNIVLSSDADLSFSVKDMMRLVDSIDKGYDLAIGCRHSLPSSYYQMHTTFTTVKGLVSKFGNIILRRLSGVNIHDFSANFRAIRKAALRRLELKENANIILFEMIIKARHRNMKITEVPVAFKDRIYGKSKLNIFIEVPRYIFKLSHYTRKIC